MVGERPIRTWACPFAEPFPGTGLPGGRRGMLGLADAVVVARTWVSGGPETRPLHGKFAPRMHLSLTSRRAPFDRRTALLTRPGSRCAGGANTGGIQRRLPDGGRRLSAGGHRARPPDHRRTAPIPVAT